MRLVEESSSSLKAKGEVSTITAKPINMADNATTPTALHTPHATRPAEKGIIIRELA